MHEKGKVKKNKAECVYHYLYVSRNKTQNMLKRAKTDKI